MNEPMTQQRLDEITKRCHKYGEAFHDYIAADQYTMGFNMARIHRQLDNDGYDLAFVELASHSISDIPALLAEVQRLRDAVEALVVVLDRNDKKGPIPDVEMMFCWLASQGVRAAFRKIAPEGDAT